MLDPDSDWRFPYRLSTRWSIETVYDWYGSEVETPTSSLVSRPSTPDSVAGIAPYIDGSPSTRSLSPPPAPLHLSPPPHAPMSSEPEQEPKPTRMQRMVRWVKKKGKLGKTSKNKTDPDWASFSHQTSSSIEHEQVLGKPVSLDIIAGLIRELRRIFCYLRPVIFRQPFGSVHNFCYQPATCDDQAEGC
jgi:hypothetical protein